MRIMPVITVVVCLGLAFSVAGALGVSDIVGSSDTAQVEDAINERTDAPGSGNSSGDRTLEPNEESGFFSFAVSAVSNMRELFGLVFYLPSTLSELGMPFAAAQALGRGIQLVSAIGLIQVALQFNIR
jgi:hypothetical protein